MKKIVSLGLTDPVIDILKERSVPFNNTYSMSSTAGRMIERYHALMTRAKLPLKPTERQMLLHLLRYERLSVQNIRHLDLYVRQKLKSSTIQSAYPNIDPDSLLDRLKALPFASRLRLMDWIEDQAMLQLRQK